MPKGANSIRRAALVLVGYIEVLGYYALRLQELGKRIIFRNFAPEKRPANMENIMHIDSVEQYSRYFGVETKHPLVNVFNGRDGRPLRFCRKLYNIYTILLKDAACGDLRYGRSRYHYDSGTMLFLAPGQVMGSDDDGQWNQPEGWVVVFHPNLLHGTPLADIMQRYSYFSYQANEALHLSEDERAVVEEDMRRIMHELQQPEDKHTMSLVVDNIKLLLDHCLRFYDRQFATDRQENSNLLVRFENLLTGYFESGQPAVQGLPSVQYCAEQLCISTGYFSDVMRQETGMSASKHIQQRALDYAKDRIFSTSLSVSQIGYALGFSYPQHFIRWFKRLSGITPAEYRRSLKNT